MGVNLWTTFLYEGLAYSLPALASLLLDHLHNVSCRGEVPPHLGRCYRLAMRLVCLDINIRDLGYDARSRCPVGCVPAKPYEMEKNMTRRDPKRLL